MPDDLDPRAVEVAPLTYHGTLAGFLLLNNWPRDTVAWSQLLVLVVRMAALPGLLQVSTVFQVKDGLPPKTHPGAVGIIIAAGRVVGEDALTPGAFDTAHPPGLLVLHPPRITVTAEPGNSTASGCVFLPGLPHLGLDHRAAWAQADLGGRVTRLEAKGDIDPFDDADTAALATLLAAA